jgi:hypothetical protein
MGSIRSLKLAIAVSRPSPAAPRARRALLCQPEPPRRIALDETSHDHGHHRRARDAGVLPIGDAEQQDALRDAQLWSRVSVGFAGRLLMPPTEHVAG